MSQPISNLHFLLLIVLTLVFVQNIFCDDKETADLNKVICGPRCVQYLLKYFGTETDLIELVREMQWPQLTEGASAASMIESLEKRNVYVKPIEVDPASAMFVWKYPIILHLKPDWYQEMFSISAEGQTKSIPVRLRVLSKVEVRPEQLFFGIVEPDSVTTKTLLLKFRDDIKPKIDISSNLENSVTWRWIKQEYPNWILEVSLQAGSGDEMPDGTLTLAFPDNDIDAKIVSVKAMVKAQQMSEQ